MKLRNFIQFGTMVLVALGTLTVQGQDQSFKVGEFNFNTPSGWKWISGETGMRKAQLAFTDEKTAEKAEVVFYHFGAGQGGTAKANVDRWLGQFQEPREKLNAKVEPKKIGNGQVTFVQAEGTYLSGMPGGPKTAVPNAKLHGAIVDGADGNVFIRMTGPKSVVEKAASAFTQMVEAPLKQ